MSLLFQIFLLLYPQILITLKSKFLKSLSLFVAVNLIVKTIYVFGIDRVVQNTVGTEVYGNYFHLFSWAIIFQIFLDLGIENFSRREIASSPILIKRYLSSIINLKIFLGLFYFFLCSIAALLKGISSYDFKLLAILMINQFLAGFILYLRANLGGLQKFKTESFISIFDRLIMIIICSILLTLPRTRNNFKIEWFILSQTFAYITVFLFSLYKVLRQVKKLRLNFNFKFYIPIIRRLWPYALLVLLMALYYRIDSILLVQLLDNGKEQAGVFAHGFRILDYLSNYALLFPLILIPSFSRMIAEKTDIAPMLRMSILILLVPSLIFLISCIPYRVQIFTLLYPNQSILASANIFTILIISFIGMCFTYTFGALLTANGNLFLLNIMAFIATLISIVLNLILIPKYQALGAAIANASAQLFTIIFHIVATFRKFNLRLDLNIITRTLILFLVLIFVVLIIKRYSSLWILNILLSTSIGFIFILILKLVKLKNIIKLVTIRE